MQFPYCPAPLFYSERFITSITSEEMKLFTFEMTFNEMQHGDGPRPGNRPPSGGPPPGVRPDGQGRGNATGDMKRRMETQSEQVVIGRLELVLKETGYCEGDYFLWDKKIDRANAVLTGECKVTEANPA